MVIKFMSMHVEISLLAELEVRVQNYRHFIVVGVAHREGFPGPKVVIGCLCSGESFHTIIPHFV